jgi:dihydrofolate reductase
MRKLIYWMSVSLDGFVEGPNRDIEWTAPDEELHTFFNEQAREIDTFIYGRRLYEIMAGYWPTADTNPSARPHEVEFARIWKDTPKIVFSKTLESVEWNTTLVRDNVVEEVTRLKQEGDRNMSVGGPTTASGLIKHGLIDEYRLFVFPVVVGRGTPYFPALDQPIKLRLVETRSFGMGVVYLRYQPATL